MIELDELAIGVGAVLLIHRPGGRLPARRLSAARRAVAEVVQVGRKAMRPSPVGTTRHLELQDPELDPDLQDAPPVPRSDLAGQDLTRLGIIGPTLDHVVQVPSHQRLPDRRCERGSRVRLASTQRDRFRDGLASQGNRRNSRNAPWFSVPSMKL